MRRRVEAEPLDEQAWDAFGWLPKRDTDPEDGKQTLRFEWSDAHANLICHHADEVPHTGAGLVCEMLFRHLTHTQVLLVLNCDAVIAVAPATCTFRDEADLEQIRAFLLHPHDTLVLHPGTWHWGPFPLEEPRVDLFNVQGLRYAEDNDCARLSSIGSSAEVVVAPA